MRLGVAVGGVLFVGVAHAQPGAPADRTAMETYREEARAAALRGDCEMVGTIAQLVAAVDARYYADVFLRDRVVVSCNRGVGGVQLPPSVMAPVEKPAPPVPEQRGRSDTGRGALGLFAGLGGGAVLGLVGLTIAGTIADQRHPNCTSFCDEVVIPAIMGGQIGMSLGLALGITLVGNHEGGKGSFGMSLSLGLVGSGVSWLFLMNDAGVDSGAAGVAIFVLPVAGTMTGYWLTHEHVSVAVVPTGNGVAVMGRY